MTKQSWLSNFSNGKTASADRPRSKPKDAHKPPYREPLSESKQAAVREQIAAGKLDRDIAFSLGLNLSQVQRIRKKS
jgi:DNA-binding NarL/FixJ family response regulator